MLECLARQAGVIVTSNQLIKEGVGTGPARRYAEPSCVPEEPATQDRTGSGATEVHRNGDWRGLSAATQR